ncbi:MAG: NADP-dependent malic enzyme [Alphaproteobacteria bacterium]|nr:NADP-dependent malic enzyme [Alphaproteobacteria bacterium]
MDEQFIQSALDYHRLPVPGKISVLPTKGLTNQRDLALAYSPGVAVACTAIAEDPGAAVGLTARGNLVAVISNGTAVLGLGNIGPLAGKPVMEGKACLFKKFAGIDVFDIEIAETEPDKLIDIVASLEPTFGGINLEDIKAPECFEVERRLRERMKIPVFHDDQHGTAIIVGAAVLNGLKVVGKQPGAVKLVCSGAGAAALACLDHLVALGLRHENIFVSDIEGVVYAGRTRLMDPKKARYAQDTAARTLGEIIDQADIFLGLSAGRVLKPEMVARMAPRPLILALANPDPEILPEEARAARPDCVIATGRSDYPNQVNNVLCFPFIFRGALDVGATTINEEMKLAATRAIARLAEAEASEIVAMAYGIKDRFGPDYLIPRPFDPRLITVVAPAVAEAAMASGVATRPIDDIRAYRSRLARFVYHSGTVMQPVFAAAANSQRRIVYAEGEDERVLRAVQIVADENLARPILIGRPEIIARRLSEHGLRLEIGRDIDIVAIDQDGATAEEAAEYHRLRLRCGVTRDSAVEEMRRNASLLGAMLVRAGKADGLLCGTSGSYETHLKPIAEAIGLGAGVNRFAAMNLLMLPRRTLFICDTYVNLDPSGVEIAEMAILAAAEVRRFGLVPRVGLLSHSNFGSVDSPSALKMRRARELIAQQAPELEVEGEMQGDAALSRRILDQVFPEARLTGDANLLIMPNLDAANITFNCLMTVAGEGVTVGPILLGTAKPAHILTATSTVRRIVNMTALTAVSAEMRGQPAS